MNERLLFTRLNAIRKSPAQCERLLPFDEYGLLKGEIAAPVKETAKPATIDDILDDAFFDTLERRRSGWQNTLDELSEELGVLRARIEQQRKLWTALPKKFSTEDMELGRDDEAKRIFAQFDRWIGQEKDYTEYLRTLTILRQILRHRRTQRFHANAAKFAQRTDHQT